MSIAHANPLPNLLEPIMVDLPGGSFDMGCNDKRAEEEGGCSDNEIPVHRVRLQPFAIGRTEITVAQFREFINVTQYRTNAEQQGFCYGDPSGTGDWDVVKGLSWQNPGFKQAESAPVTCVSWEDAQAYIRWLNKQTQANYRLPTEAEWEYAARGGKENGAYPWGNRADDGCQAANMADQRIKQQIPAWQSAIANCNDGYVYTAPVASFSANGYDLHDMHGNVWEWVQDCYHDNYHDAPADGSAWENEDCPLRGLRGGSWFGEPELLSSSDRFGFNAATSDFSLGFRVAADFSPIN